MRHLSTLFLVFITASALFNNALAAELTTVSLNNTDGYGLLEKPAPRTDVQKKRQYQSGIDACESNCVTPFGVTLGSADGINGYSNCQSICIKPEFSFMSLADKSISIHAKNPNTSGTHYVGLINQCVEYARRWWMANEGITFGDIDSAHEIIYLTEGKKIHSSEHFALARSINGSAKRAPRRADLLIYYPDPSNPLWRHGHVAVVVAVDLEEGSVSVAEQNYSNKPWAKPDSYSRKIKLFNIGGRYQIIDTELSSSDNAGGGLISGWIYPAPHR